MRNFIKYNFLKIILYIFLFITIYLMFFFLKNFFYFNLYLYKNNTFFNYINFFGISLLISGVFVGLFIYWLADTRVLMNKIFSLICYLLFIILIFFFITEKSYINLFFIYELFLLPSFFLIYYLSPNRRSLPVSIYFLTWTQFGSLLVLIAIICIFIITKSIYLLPNMNINNSFIFFLLFIGFGIKIPLWPFYYWLTKTHVEASSFFSIYLSGFLVKTALYFFFHFFSIFNNIFYLNFLFIIILIGIVDSSLKMWSQIDLKKLIAYTTVQEMNILCILLFWNNEFSFFILSYFTITHCLLSSLFFFIIDILLKRFNSRSSTKITGLVHTMPLFSICLFISIILFVGLPFTAKFYSEILIFNLLFNYNLESFFLIFLSTNLFAVLGFCKNFFNILFGHPILINVVYDLSKKEVKLFILIWLNLFLLNYTTFLIF